MVGVEEGREFRFRGDLYSQESTFPLVLNFRQPTSVRHRWRSTKGKPYDYKKQMSSRLYLDVRPTIAGRRQIFLESISAVFAKEALCSLNHIYVTEVTLLNYRGHL